MSSVPPSTQSPRIAVLPDRTAEWMRDAVVAGGGELVDVSDTTAMIWGAARDPQGLADVLDANPHLRWIQLPFAGVEEFAHLIDGDRLWTCGKGVYAEPVAEMAVSMALAGLRGLVSYARATQWSPPIGRNLIGARVSVLGGGGITEEIVRLLKPFDCHVTVVRQHVTDMDGVDVVLDSDRYIDALPGADVVFLALPLTPETEGMLGRSEFESMERHAWLVNVARGKHVVTDDLVWALANGVIAGAALDVTDPEPLPAEHPLWTLPNCLITPHVGNTPAMAIPLLSERITNNVRRWIAGDELVGPVDHQLGY
ncbi:MAG: D-isomer specific 2-hydroxyacid dehydrogenase family protein [Ilumatobacteraceae bacterium]